MDGAALMYALIAIALYIVVFIGFGIAIAVAKKLIENKPERKLAVVSAVG
jgi:uncharacterized protein YneF (UPF0154 family)